MSDGQSESCEGNAAAAKADRDRFLEQCRAKIEFKVPGLTSDEQRLLWQIASGQSLPPIKKLCPHCGGDGHVLT